jgi:hypothetical protein
MRSKRYDIVPLDDDTAAWLAHLGRVTKTPATEIVASMLRAIRVDDEAAHAIERQLSTERYH